MTIRNKKTGEITSAQYAPNSSGNLRMNVNGKFYTDKQFDKIFEQVKENELDVNKNAMPFNRTIED